MTPTLQTDRLLLRAFERSDAAAVFNYASNPNVSRYTTWDTHRSIADSEAFIEWVFSHPPDQHTWAIVHREASKLIGAVEFTLNIPTEGQIDYVLAEPYWNQGYTTEAARAALAYGLRQYPTVHRVISCAMPDNIGSQRVMEKCGLTFERAKSSFWKKFHRTVELRQFAMTVP
jgi:ribosomal-protein-alanine N-acetyltransferase